MHEPNNEIHIDYKTIAQQIADKAIAEFLASLMPDEKTKKLMLGMMAIHRKYGIDTVTSIKILQDFAEFSKEIET